MGAAEILRGSEHAAQWSLEEVISIAKASGDSYESERSEFISLMEKARELKSKLARR